MTLKPVQLLFLFFTLISFTTIAQQKSYFGQAELGFLLGRGEEQWDGSHDERIDVSFMTFHGVHISENHVIGLSTGWDQYDKISVIPIALGWRGFLGKDGKPKIYAGLDLGGGSTMMEKKESNEWSENWYEGGLMISPSLGFTFPARKSNTALTLSFSYKRQEISEFWGSLLQPGATTLVSDQLPPEFGSLTENKYLFRSFVFRAGLMF